MSETERKFDEACRALRNAQRAFDRSRSMRNASALLKAQEAHEAACEAMHAEREVAEKAHRRAEREARFAPENAAAAAQMMLL